MNLYYLRSILYLALAVILHPVRGESWISSIKCKISSSSTPQWDNNAKLRIGYFDVDSGVDSDGVRSHYMMSLAAGTYSGTKEGDYVLTDVRIETSNQPNTKCPSGYQRSCFWDVTSGYSTSGLRGHWDIALCTKHSRFSYGVPTVESVIVRASNSQGPPGPPEGYVLRGSWDVSSGGSYSHYDGSSGHWDMGIYIKKKIPVPRKKVYISAIRCEVTGSSKPEWKEGVQLKLGYFDVDSGVDDDWERNHYMMSLAADTTTKQDGYVLTDLRVEVSDWPYTKCPGGYQRTCFWDVDSGYSTGGKKGHWDIALCTKRSIFTYGVPTVTSVILRASSTQGAPNAPEGYSLQGFWDVSSGGSYSYYDGSSGHWDMGIYIKKETPICKSCIIGAPVMQVRQNGWVSSISCEITGSSTPQWKKGKQLKLGYFDVDSGVDSDGEKGHYMMSLAAGMSSGGSKYVVTDVRIETSNHPNTRCPIGYQRNCFWDVSSGYSTNGKRGHWDIALCTKQSRLSYGTSAVASVIVRASNTRGAPKPPPGYVLRGYWDVSSGGSYSYYDGSYGQWDMGIYIKMKTPSCLTCPMDQLYHS